MYTYLIGDTIDVSKIDCYLYDEESGEITINLGIISCSSENVCFELDIRFPVTFTAEEVTERLERYFNKYGAEVKFLDGEKPLLYLKTAILY